MNLQSITAIAGHCESGDRLDLCRRHLCQPSAARGARTSGSVGRRFRHDFPRLAAPCWLPPNLDWPVDEAWIGQLAATAKAVAAHQAMQTSITRKMGTCVHFILPLTAAAAALAAAVPARPRRKPLAGQSITVLMPSPQGANIAADFEAANRHPRRPADPVLGRHPAEAGDGAACRHSACRRDGVRLVVDRPVQRRRLV